MKTIESINFNNDKIILEIFNTEIEINITKELKVLSPLYNEILEKETYPIIICVQIMIQNKLLANIFNYCQENSIKIENINKLNIELFQELEILIKKICKQIIDYRKKYNKFDGSLQTMFPNTNIVI
jgi:hypothetical protein